MKSNSIIFNAKEQIIRDIQKQALKNYFIVSERKCPLNLTANFDRKKELNRCDIPEIHDEMFEQSRNLKTGIIDKIDNYIMDDAGINLLTLLTNAHRYVNHIAFLKKYFKYFIAFMLNVLIVLGRSKVTHRDIKLENILINVRIVISQEDIDDESKAYNKMLELIRIIDYDLVSRLDDIDINNYSIDYDSFYIHYDPYYAWSPEMIVMSYYMDNDNNRTKIIHTAYRHIENMNASCGTKFDKEIEYDKYIRINEIINTKLAEGKTMTQILSLYADKIDIFSTGIVLNEMMNTLNIEDQNIKSIIGEMINIDYDQRMNIMRAHMICNYLLNNQSVYVEPLEISKRRSRRSGRSRRSRRRKSKKDIRQLTDIDSYYQKYVKYKVKYMNLLSKMN